MKAVFHLLTEQGMMLVLLVLCAVFSILTWSEQQPNGSAGARQLAPTLVARPGAGGRVLIATAAHPQDQEFAATLREELQTTGIQIVEVVQGEPRDARRALEKLARAGGKLDAIACSPTASQWLVLADISEEFPGLSQTLVLTPRAQRWPIFLNPENLLNIANRIAVIAIVAIGMTMVIITAGIDLSVGSLLALSAVTAAMLIREGGGTDATTLTLLLSCLAGILVCAVVGTFSGVMVAYCGVPSFIVTLGVMQISSGLAFRLTGGESIAAVPDHFVWLGRGADLFGLPNAVILMLLLYLLAHLVMTRTVIGRHLYAVGGNSAAARYSGVQVKRVLLFAYLASGFLAGLGGIVLASLHRSGSPRYGEGYELAVIAAVVVGGTSLSGGKGTIFGTLVGALIIAVIQNGMNLTGVEPYTQKIILGAVILAAVLLDQLKRRDRGR